MKTFVMGDIHGAYTALRQCLETSQFNRHEDRLICLGDVCDRGPQVKECIDELLTLPQCVCILGNHDAWALTWATEGSAPQEWLEQGGAQTVLSYKNGMPPEHIRFLSQASLYFVDRNRLFVHGGFDPDRPVSETPKEILIWDRSLLKQAQEMQNINPEYKFGNFEEVYIGHTPTQKYGKSVPQKFCNVFAMDTGAGHGAKLSIMDLDTKEFWQANS